MKQILVFIYVFYAFPKLWEGKVLKFLEYIYLVSKTYKSKIFIKFNQILYFWMFIVFHDLSLFISVKAFLPSLRVLKTSQVREEIINTIRVIREIWVVSILLANLIEFFMSL